MKPFTVYSPKKPPPVRPTPTVGHGGAPQPSRVLVPLTRDYPGGPCVCVVFLGEPPSGSQHLMVSYQKQAADHQCNFSALVIQDNSPDTQHLLANNAPGPSTFLVRLAGQPLANVNEHDLGYFKHNCRIHPGLGADPLDANNLDTTRALDTLGAYVIDHVARTVLGCPPEDRTSTPKLMNLWMTKREPLLEPHIDSAYSKGHHGSLLASQSDPKVHDLTAQMHALEARDSATREQDQTFTTTRDFLAHWLHLSEEVKASQVWAAIEQSPAAKDVLAFFLSLRPADFEGTGEIGILAREVATTLAQDPSFASEVSAMASHVMSLDFCTVAFRWHHLQTALILHESFRADLPPRDALRIARCWFRHTAMFHISGNREGKFTTHLAYVHKLFKDDSSDPEKSVDLGGRKPEASHCGKALSRLTDRDITLACQELQRMEQDEFVAFLANWAPWRRALQGHSAYSTRMKEFNDTLAGMPHAMEVGMETLQAMERDGLTRDEQRTLYPAYFEAADRQLTNQHWESLTTQVMRELDS